MKKSQKILGMGIFVLILLVLLLFNNQKKTTVTQSLTSYEQELEFATKSLLDLEYEDILSFSFLSGNNELNITRKNNNWLITDHNNFRLDNIKIDILLRELIGLKFDEDIEISPKSLDSWGINKDSDKVILYGEGQKIILHVGNNNLDNTAYYIQIEGDNKIYLIKKRPNLHFSITIDDLRIKELFKIDYGNIKSIFIKNKNTSFRIEPFPIGVPFYANVFSYVITEPYKSFRPINAEGLGSFINSIPNPLYIEEYIANSKDIKFNDINLEIEEFSGKKHTLLLGKDYNSTTVYAKTLDDWVFTLNKNDLKFIESDPFDLIDKFFQLVPLDSIDEIHVEKYGFSFHCSLGRTSEGIVYYVNDISVSEEEFRDLYKSFVSIFIEGVASKDLRGKEVAQISFKKIRTKDDWLRITFWEYDEEYYLLTKNNEEGEFIAGKYQLDRLFLAIDSALSKISIDKLYVP